MKHYFIYFFVGTLLLNACKEDDFINHNFVLPVGSNGVKYHDNLIWITDLFGQNITAFDPESGVIQIQYNFKSLNLSPDDLIFLDDGTIIWTAPPEGHIGKITPQGEIVDLGYVGSNVNPIERKRDSQTVFIGFEKTPSRVCIIDNENGIELGTVNDLPSMNGFSFAEDGLLYAPLFDLNDFLGPGGVIKIDFENNSYENWEVTFPLDENKNQFKGTTATVADYNGSIYVLESLNPRIYKVDMQTGEAIRFASVPFAISDNLDYHDGKVYVTSFIQNIVFEVDQAGNRRKIQIKLPN